MIYEILLPLPLNKTFSYQHPYPFKSSDKLLIGSLVEVEFNKKILVGLVSNITDSESSNRPLKKIKKICNPFFNKEIIESINFISHYTCNKKSLILKLFLSGFSNRTDFLKIKSLKQNKKLSLNTDQKSAVKYLLETNFKKFTVVLLEGVTGSGKTRVYMNKAEEVIEAGFQCLILVPEIILTTQWVKEIEEDYGLDALVYHSSIKKKEREKIWFNVNQNKIKLIIGTRSALFLPFSKLGLIVVDEEHDNSYKQEEQTIINARDFAIVRARNSNCMIILSSATPSIESSYNVKINKFKHLQLSERVNNLSLPKVNIIDMRNEKDMISRDIMEIVSKNIKNGYQTLIYINKRGYAPFVICKNCGYTKDCEKCNTSLVLHDLKNKKGYLLCHHCNYREKFLNICEICGSEDKFLFPGVGVEKIHELISNEFPQSESCILSSDTIKNHEKFKVLITKIISNKIDIIIGTQLITKGHNFPFLKTVIILNIDNLLNDINFRSYEKTFQQIIQVSGRAGRKKLQGEVFIQTFQPNHQVINLCKSQNIKNFIQWEIESRKKNLQPPFKSYISLILISKLEKELISFSNIISEKIKNTFNELTVYGPAPALLYKKNLDFRYRILLKLEKPSKIQNNIKTFLINLQTPSKVRLYIDVDPMNFI